MKKFTELVEITNIQSEFNALYSLCKFYHSIMNGDGVNQSKIDVKEKD